MLYDLRNYNSENLDRGDLAKSCHSSLVQSLSNLVSLHDCEENQPTSVILPFCFSNSEFRSGDRGLLTSKRATTECCNKLLDKLQ
jgi:hypothetical protein